MVFTERSIMTNDTSPVRSMQATMEEVQTGGNAFVNGTTLHGRFVLRSCALHYALTVDDVVAIIEEVLRVGVQCQV
jgi:hypothetical protein